MIGNVTRSKNRFGPGQMSFQNPGEQLSKYINLCSACQHYKPGLDSDCPHRVALLQLQREHQLGGPVTRCAYFEQKPDRRK